MDIKRLFAFISLILFISCINYKINLSSFERHCFYQVFAVDQKYSYIVHTPQRAKHEVIVSHIEGKQWKQIFNQNLEGQNKTRVDKLASVSTTYSFCLQNKDPLMMTFRIEINTGLELMELVELAEAKDNENLEQELEWIDKETDKLGEKSLIIQSLLNSNKELSHLVSTKILVFGILGLLSIGGVNYLFFSSLKKAFREKKLI